MPIYFLVFHLKNFSWATASPENILHRGPVGKVEDCDPSPVSFWRAIRERPLLPGIYFVAIVVAHWWRGIHSSFFDFGRNCIGLSARAVWPMFAYVPCSNAPEAGYRKQRCVSYFSVMTRLCFPRRYCAKANSLPKQELNRKKLETTPSRMKPCVSNSLPLLPSFLVRISATDVEPWEDPS